MACVCAPCVDHDFRGSARNALFSSPILTWRHRGRGLYLFFFFLGPAVPEPPAPAAAGSSPALVGLSRSADFPPPVDVGLAGGAPPIFSARPVPAGRMRWRCVVGRGGGASGGRYLEPDAAAGMRTAIRRRGSPRRLRARNRVGRARERSGAPSASSCGSLPHMYVKKRLLSFSSLLTSCAWSVSNFKHCGAQGEVSGPAPPEGGAIGARRGDERRRRVVAREQRGCRATLSFVTFSTSLPSQCRYLTTYRVCARGTAAAVGKRPGRRVRGRAAARTWAGCAT